MIKKNSLVNSLTYFLAKKLVMHHQIKIAILLLGFSIYTTKAASDETIKIED